MTTVLLFYIYALLSLLDEGIIELKPVAVVRTDPLLLY